VGRLAHTPELKALPSGLKVMNASLATNYFYKDKSDQKQEGTDWHNLVAYGKTAETMAQYLKGGDQIIVHGSLKTKSWDDKDGGAKRYRTEVNVERFEFGAKNMKRDDRQDGYDNQENGDTEPSVDYPSDDINPDDIPF
jgi:single-strand DNA-binding protein